MTLGRVERRSVVAPAAEAPGQGEPAEVFGRPLGRGQSAGLVPRGTTLIWHAIGPSLALGPRAASPSLDATAVSGP
ncbi:MAG TPA: hypothetical protein VFF52_15950 [Isosphaeraceae bacterium]|nr:hypothetical protein [Isosphaeraceae bacterium]